MLFLLLTVSYGTSSRRPRASSLARLRLSSCHSAFLIHEQAAADAITQFTYPTRSYTCIALCITFMYSTRLYQIPPGEKIEVQLYNSQFALKAALGRQSAGSLSQRKVASGWQIVCPPVCLPRQAFRAAFGCLSAARISARTLSLCCPPQL